MQANCDGATAHGEQAALTDISHKLSSCDSV
jgi:hypothetical protein